MRYDYTIALWVMTPGNRFSAALVSLLEMLPRLTLTLTEDEFMKFRCDLMRDGFDLHEVERAPHHEPEHVL